VAQQVASGSASIFGVMVESHLVPGAQKFTPGEHDPAKLAYGQSITDACIGWDDSVAVLETLANAVRPDAPRGAPSAYPRQRPSR
jgi:3-deoxy-7-phosphoheptulonate synthase